MPSFGNQFINYADWAKLNQPDAQRMAQQLASGVQTQGQAEQGSLADLQKAFGVGTDTQQRLSDMAGYVDVLGQANNVSTAANNLGSIGGVAQQLSQQYGAPANRFDASLAYGAGAPQFSQLQKQYGDLSNALGVADQNSYTNYLWAHKPGNALPTAAAQTPGMMKGPQIAQAKSSAGAGYEASGPYTFNTGSANSNQHAYRGTGAGRAGRRGIYDTPSGTDPTTNPNWNGALRYGSAGGWGSY